MPESELESNTETATVKVWSGPTRQSYDQLLEDDPDEYELEIQPEDKYYIPHDDHTVVDGHIENHQKYAFYMDVDESLTLIVETNDSHHSPKEGFEDGRPLEGGLVYVPEGHPRHETRPFKVEIWGRVRMRVERSDT